MSVRNCLSYVLNNWRRHREDRGWLGRAWEVDPFSTGWQFPWWSERADEVLVRWPPPGYESLIVWLPKTWLLREGWRKRAAGISLHHVPGASA